MKLPDPDEYGELLARIKAWPLSSRRQAEYLGLDYKLVAAALEFCARKPDAYVEHAGGKLLWIAYDESMEDVGHGDQFACYRLEKADGGE